LIPRSPADLLRPGSLNMHQRPDQMPWRSAREIDQQSGGRPSELLDSYCPGRADYPARLLTRRSLALRAESILKARANAPRSCPAPRGR
jgi:hypothetical protein